MSTTYQVSNGDIFINRDTGRLVEVTGIEKLGQDLASALLLEYDAERDFGSELMTLEIPTGTASKGFVSQLVSEAVSRLEAYQRDDLYATSDEIINSIDAIRVAFDANSHSQAYFYLVVSNQAGTSLQGVFQLTQLNQQLNPGASLQLIALQENLSSLLSGV